MKKLILLISLLLPFALTAQEFTNKIRFEKGKHYLVESKLKLNLVQEVMGRSIEMESWGDVVHEYEVKKRTADSTVLFHRVKRIRLGINGMGSFKNVDSDNPEDISGPNGEGLKQYLAKTFEITVDNKGTVLSATEKNPLPPPASNEGLLERILRQIAETMDPPKPGGKSFFKILPDTVLAIGTSWKDSTMKAGNNSLINYTLSKFSESDVIIDFTGVTHLESKSESNGMETTTTMEGTTSGKIMIDRKTGIVKQKFTENIAAGNVEAMNQQVPLSSKATLTATVTQK